MQVLNGSPDPLGQLFILHGVFEGNLGAIANKQIVIVRPHRDVGIRQITIVTAAGCFEDRVGHEKSGGAQADRGSPVGPHHAAQQFQSGRIGRKADTQAIPDQHPFQPGVLGLSEGHARPDRSLDIQIGQGAEPGASSGTCHSIGESGQAEVRDLNVPRLMNLESGTQKAGGRLQPGTAGGEIGTPGDLGGIVG